MTNDNAYTPTELSDEELTVAAGGSNRNLTVWQCEIMDYIDYLRTNHTQEDDDTVQTMVSSLFQAIKYRQVDAIPHLETAKKQLLWIRDNSLHRTAEKKIDNWIARYNRR